MSTDGIMLSLILPAYNEALRLPPFLASVRAWLDGHYPGRYEVLVVDDGGHDGLLAVLEQQAAGWPQLRWLRHPQNLGKGAAVRTGILAAEGELLLFADADGATPITEEAPLAAAIRAGADVAVGSRLISAPGAERSRVMSRALGGRLFAGLARRLFRLPVRDPQCGFKMFRRDVGRRLFSLSSESGYLFDVELLILATRLGYRIAEVPVSWREIPGGHFRVSENVPGIMASLWRLCRRRQWKDG